MEKNETEKEESKKTETIEESQEPKKLWVDVISGNKNPANGMVIEFVAPKMVNGEIEVEIEEADIELEMKSWDLTLIMYVLGEDLSTNTKKQYMEKMWNFVQQPDMFYNDEAYFILRFCSMQDKDGVMMKGSYTIRDMPMMPREWIPDFNLKKNMLRTLSI